MLGRLFKRNKDLPEEENRKLREAWLQDMLEKSQKLSRLIHNEKAGWKEFCALIEDYIDKAKKRKALTALDRATDAEIQSLKYIDHEIYILMWVMRIPQQFIEGVEAEIKKDGK
ncbi:MAG: hypothetical protein WC404_03430 [Candidatus Omnitrophota bacterium]|jgi:hypothetical protein